MPFSKELYIERADFKEEASNQFFRLKLGGEVRLKNAYIIKAESVQEIEGFCEGLQHILMAVSWGGYESLIIPKCSGMPRQDFNAQHKEHRMLRLYVGMEDAAYIIKDLERGFGSMHSATQ